MSAVLEQRLEQVRLHESEKTTLLEDLIQRYRQAAEELSVIKEDLEAERKVRRLYKERIDCLEGELKIVQHASFVLVLLDADADGYLFDNLLIYKGTQGGIEAANKLRDAVRRNLVKQFPELDRAPVIVRAFANSDGLCEALRNADMSYLASKLPEFIKGFNQVDSCDFVCVGSGKDRADEKVKGTFKIFLENPTCKHIALAACHDNGYVRLLENVHDKRHKQKVTLVESFQTGKEFKQLKMRSTKFAGVFRGTPLRPSNSISTIAKTSSHITKSQAREKSPSCIATNTSLGTGNRRGPSRRDTRGATNAKAGGEIDRRKKICGATVSAKKSLEKKLDVDGKRFCIAYFVKGTCASSDCSYLHAGLNKEELSIWKEEWVCKRSRK